VVTTTPDAGDNDQLDFGESATLSLTIHNIGSQPSGSATVTLSSGSSYITFTDATEASPPSPQTAPSTSPTPFCLQSRSHVPDGTLIPITVSMSDGSYSGRPPSPWRRTPPNWRWTASPLWARRLAGSRRDADVKVWLANNGPPTCTTWP
jgi:hypothetical protein